MTLSSTATASPVVEKFPSAFWERLWRVSGIGFVAFALVAFALYGHQPGVGASTDALTAFYDGNRTRILIAAIVSGMAVLNLMWFAAALRAALAEAGKDGWGGAVTAAGAMVGGLALLLVTLTAARAYAVAGAGNPALAPGLNDFAWALLVLTAFPRAMLIMAGSFGLWRAGSISNKLFAGGVAAVVLTLLGGTTWLGGDIWSPDGLYSRLISPAIGLLWVVIVSGLLVTRGPGGRAAW